MNNRIDSPINLGNPHEISMIQLASKVLDLADSKSEIIFNDLPIDDPKQRRPDVSLAEEMIGWRPKVDIEEGLKHSIEYFRSVI